MKTTTMKTITAEEFDEKFDNGEDIMQYLDMENARVSIRLLLPVKLRKKLLTKAKTQNKSLEELILTILETNEK